MDVRSAGRCLALSPGYDAAPGTRETVKYDTVIKAVEGDIVSLRDGSVWRVDVISAPKLASWRPEEAVQCDTFFGETLMTNLPRREVVVVTKLS
jgi:hypothetical protein